jgi:hypothetical protein
MRNFALSLGVLLLFAATAGAQSNQQVSPSPLSPLSEYALNAPAEPAPASSSAVPSPGDALPAAPAPSASASAASSPAEALPAAPSAVPASPAGPAPQDVHGVYQNYSFQIYGGYTFTRFYEVPHVTQNQNGFNFGAVYYYRSGFVGADGEMMAMFGSAFGLKSRLAFGGGGPRIRWSGPRGVELWGHGLVGGAHLTPRTAFGTQGAFAYEIGGGVDRNAGHRRLAYRMEADMLGTRFFNTFQYSPKVSVGIAYRF